MIEDDTIPLIEPVRLPAHIRALVVDDDGFQQAVVAEVLQGLSIHDITAASNGECALKLLQNSKSPFNLLVLDLCMPGMDGFQFMDRVAQLGYMGALVIVSGQKAEVVRAASMVAQWRCFQFLGALGKPLAKQDLAKLIEQAQAPR